MAAAGISQATLYNLGEAFYSELLADPVRPVNSARFVFLNPRATEFFLDWESIAGDVVGVLRAEAGRDPYDRRLCDLIGELSTRSDEFRVRWATHHVKLHRTGVKRFHHPVVGDLTLDFEALDLPGDRGQKLLIYTAEPNRAPWSSSWRAFYGSTRTYRAPLELHGLGDVTARLHKLMAQRDMDGMLAALPEEVIREVLRHRRHLGRGRR